MSGKKPSAKQRRYGFQKRERPPEDTGPLTPRQLQEDIERMEANIRPGNRYRHHIIAHGHRGDAAVQNPSSWSVDLFWQQGNAVGSGESVGEEKETVTTGRSEAEATMYARHMANKYRIPYSLQVDHTPEQKAAIQRQWQESGSDPFGLFKPKDDKGE